MNDVFVVCNQLGQYWGKKKKWVDGTDPKRVLTCKHEDEAVNQLVELSARDIDLRGEVRAAETNERGVPQLEPSEHLLADEPEPIIELVADADGERDSKTPDHCR
ncbi:MAG: hypothetical protein O7F73_15395 [Gammaproteobacteria bacterium]|nr:hypothetical protein [Gammaproteobacteria bacterium]